ncbi:MAG: DNA cytosine methyltransferase [Kiritimatiellae bacterium]|nr:DNA cytosine methyltransferase [Kiritimatiellia bacterium]
MDKLQIGMFSFFTGAGFLDLGFEACGFIPLAANEIDANFARVYRYSREKMGLKLPKFGLQEESVTDFLDEQARRDWLHKCIDESSRSFDFVGFVGGPPCPDFSVAGKQAGSQGKHGHLSQVYIDAIREFRPDFFVFENVKGLLKTARHRAFFDSLVRQVQQAGYATDWRLLNSLWYGVAQDRERVILFGVRKDRLKQRAIQGECHLAEVPWEARQAETVDDIGTIPWPDRHPFRENGKLQKPKSVPEELTVEYWFRKNSVDVHPNATDFFIPRAGLEKMKRFDEGDDSKKCYKRLHRWRYSPTAAYGSNEVHLHPYKPRRLSVAEALAIQSLPKVFELPPDISLSAKFKTIGNGVPYLLAKGVAETFRDFLEKEGEA